MQGVGRSMLYIPAKASGEGLENAYIYITESTLIYLNLVCTEFQQPHLVDQLPSQILPNLISQCHYPNLPPSTMYTARNQLLSGRDVFVVEHSKRLGSTQYKQRSCCCIPQVTVASLQCIW